MSSKRIFLILNSEPSIHPSQAPKSFEPSGMSKQTALGNRTAQMPLADRNERILSATSTRPRQHSAFGSSLPPSKQSTMNPATQLANTNASRQPASRPGSARPTSADLLHGRGKTVMYEQLARATTARPSSGRATGRAVATFTPTNRYVDQAAAGSLRARAGVDVGVDSGVSTGSTSAYTTRYRPPVVVSNATLRERDWNNPNSPASRVKSAGVTRSRPETAPIASIRTPVNTRAIAPAPSSTATARVQSALEKLAVSDPVTAVTDEPTSVQPRREARFDARRDDLEPETLADIVAASVPPAVRTTPAPPIEQHVPAPRVVNYAVSAGIEPRSVNAEASARSPGNHSADISGPTGSPTTDRSSARRTVRPYSAVARPVMDIGSVNERCQLPGYNLGKIVGEGGFCKVRLGVHQVTGAKTAVKLVDKDKLTAENDKRRVGREIRVLKRLAHEHVIRLFDVVDSPKIVYVVMEYADGGSLLDYVRARKKLSEKEAARFFHQLCRALEHCHQHGIVHRDVKLENVLLDAGENVKLIDFGLSAVLVGDGKKLKVHCGSPSYAAPEIVARRAYDGPPVDVWSAGIVLFAMVCGYLPFHAHGGNKQELCAKIQRGVFTIPNAASEDFKALIKTVLRVDPQRRASLRQCLDSPWIRTHVRSRDHDAGKAAPAHYPAAVAGADLDVARLESLTDAGLDRRRLVEHLRAADHNYYTAAYHLLAYRDTAAAGADVNFETEAAAAKKAARAPAAPNVPRVAFAPKPTLIPGHGEYPTTSKVAGITRAQTARSPHARGRAAAPVAGGGVGREGVSSARGGPERAAAVTAATAGYARSTEAARSHRAATLTRPGSSGQRRTVY